MLWVVGQPWCNSTKITGPLKPMAFSTSIGTIMQASVGLINRERLYLSENTMVNLIQPNSKPGACLNWPVLLVRLTMVTVHLVTHVT